MALRFSARSSALVLVATAAAALTGCGLSTGSTGKTVSTTVLATVGLSGRVHGGNQPVTGAAITLWAAGTSSGYGKGATSVATTTTDSNGSFTFNTGGVSPCTLGQYLYVTAVGGNTGSGTANPSSAMMAASPTPCNTSTGASTIYINEVTTVAAVTALQQFMSITPGGLPAWNIGAPSSNVIGLSNAFLQSANLANPTTGVSQAFTVTNSLSGTTYTTTITPNQAKIYTEANILAACVNTAGGNTCNSLFSDTTPGTLTAPGTGTAPTDTIQVAYNLATNPAGLTMNAHNNAQGSPYYLCNQYALPNPPFVPATTMSCSATFPNDWTQDVKWNNPAGTVSAAGIAIDASGNIWTSPVNSANGITEFNQAGQMILTPVTSTTITGGWSFSTCGSACTGTYSFSTGSHASGNTIAIDTNGNAWSTDWNGAIVNNVGNTSASASVGTYEGVAFEVTNVGGTGTSSGYLMGTSGASIAIDGSNNLYFGDITNNCSTGCSVRYYLSELEAAAPAYSTLLTSSYHATSAYATEVVMDSNPLGQHAYEFNTTAETSIPVMANGLAALPNVGSGTPLPTAVTFGVADANYNLWASTGATTAGATGLEYINVASSYTAPTVTPYAIGTSGNALGGLYAPTGLAIDGVGNLWVLNSTSSAGGVSEFVPGPNGTTLTPMSPSGTGIYGFFTNGGTLSGGLGVAIDSSGNVWMKNKGSNMYYLAGAAAPVVTPLSVQNKNGAVGTRP